MKKLFISISVDEATKKSIINYKQQFSNRKIRWVKKENLHLTALFIGFIDNEAVLSLTNKIKNIMGKHQRSILTFDKMILVPPNNVSNMIWAKYNTNENLTSLVQDLSSCLDIINNKNLIPHITVARFEEDLDLKPLPKLQLLDIAILSLSLMESLQNENGVYYNELSKFHLK